MFDGPGPIILANVAVAVLLGVMRPGRLRSALVLVWFLAPVLLVGGIAAQPDFEVRQHEFSREMFFGFGGFIALAFSGAFTLFPFKLTSRLLAIHRGE